MRLAVAMLNVKLICVGKLKERFYAEACAEYQKRLSTMCRLEICELDELSGRPDALERESAKILQNVPSGAYVIALCIEGDMLTSEGLSQRIERLAGSGHSKICLIIGSSTGLHDSVKQRADFRLSMSRMTFAHHLARVMVLEQVYRALSITAGTKYHK